MHELSIAEGIVSLVEEQARNRGAAGIEEVELEIGRLSGVEPLALDFALESAVKGTLLAGARLVRRYISGEGKCTDCEAVFPLDSLPAPCPACGSWWVAVVRGRELRVKSVVVSFC